ncbi:MAG: amidohydrolase family protein, partial [Wenzhouxiangella sp.]
IEQGPVHLHISEQPGEVAECRRHTGKTPASLLADEVGIDQRWCLIHATHASDSEVGLIAESGAVVGICPTTEADLGDGLFPVRSFLDRGGRVAIGSDSNLVTSAAEELRLLDWGQRLMQHERNVLCDEGAHIGSSLWRQCAVAGAAALDQPAGRLAPGCRGDFVLLDDSHPMLQGLEPGQALDTLIFAHQPAMIDAVHVQGERVVDGGVHRERARLAGRIAQLRHRLARS